MAAAATAKAKKQNGLSQPVKPIQTINDLMDDIHHEIAGIKSGEISEPKARVIAKNRSLQVKGFEVMLQAARLEARFRTELGRRLGVPMIEAPP
jgi:hypothetical protein